MSTSESDAHLDDGVTEPADASAPLGPVREHERIRSLDVLRGVAILGIFLVNIQFFTLPLMEAVGHLGMESASTQERLGWSFIKAFCEFKFISMFSLLFGVGLVIQMTRAEAAGRGFAPVFLRRLGILALFGLCHAFLLWYGDILFIYAVLGTLLLALRKLQARTLFISAAACVLVGTLLTGSCASLQLIGNAFAPQAVEAGEDGPAEAAPDDETATANELADSPDEIMLADDVAPADETAESEPARGLVAMQRAQFDPSRDTWIQAEVLAYREGPFAEAFLFRAVSYGFAAISAIFGYGWRIVGMFMLGAALMKVDFFRPHRIQWQKKMALIGLGIGLPLELGAVALQWLDGFQLGVTWLLATIIHDLGSVAMCLGYVGAITAAVSAGASGVLTAGFSRVGRLALSAYLTETIIATFIMYWWGLGWFATLGRPQQLGLVVVVYAAIMVLAAIWLRFFRIGPFEWLWRSMTYLRPQPLLRK